MATTTPLQIEVESDLPALNTDLLGKVITWAVQDHEQLIRLPGFAAWGTWNQGSWAEEIRNGACQTSYCIAGQAVTQAGYGMIYEDWSPRPDGSKMASADYCAPMVDIIRVRDGKEIRSRVPDPEEERRDIQEVGKEVLGLTDREASRMFSGSNDIEDVVSYAFYFARRRGVDLDVPDWVRDYDQHWDDSDARIPII